MISKEKDFLQWWAENCLELLIEQKSDRAEKASSDMKRDEESREMENSWIKKKKVERVQRRKIEWSPN